MAKKITELTEATTCASSDLVLVVTDPASTPVTKKMTVGNFVGSGLLINTGNLTLGADSDVNGVGAIALQTGGVTRLQITAAGEIQLGEVVPNRLHAVYTFGDSLTEATDYSSKLTALLGAEWSVRNCGIGGNTTTQMAARLTSNVLNAGDGEYIVVLGGINDIVGDASAATIESNLQAIYDAAAGAGLTVVACTITPFKTNAYWTSGRQTVLDTVNTWILNTAANVDVAVDTYDALEDGTSDTLTAAYASADYLHLSTAGYELLATTIYNAVTWTPSTTQATVFFSGGTLYLNQSLRNTDSPTFANLTVARHLDFATWYPTTDGTAALKISNAAQAAILTIDTTNKSVGMGTTAETDTAMTISRSSTGANSVYGAQFRSLKIDASGTVAGTALLATSYAYAISASNSVASIGAVQGACSSVALSPYTQTIGSMTAFSAQTPQLSGGGAHAVTASYGLYVDNQGVAGITLAFGIKISDQSGAAANYAFYSGGGLHSIGSTVAEIGFYGHTPTTQQVLATGAGATVDNVITALQNLGLVKQS